MDGGGRAGSWIRNRVVAPWSPPAISDFNWPAAASVMLASVAWSAGSLYALRTEQPTSPFLSTSMQMLCGSAWLLLAGTLTGEWKPINLAHASGAPALLSRISDLRLR
jgi:hypothetical protein